MSDRLLSKQSHSAEVADMLSQLCALLAGDKKEGAYQFTVRYLSTFTDSYIANNADELALYEGLKAMISSLKSPEEAELFDGLYDKLMKNDALRHKKDILTFLWSISKYSNSSLVMKPFIEADLMGTASKPPSQHAIEVEHLFKAPSLKSSSHSNSDGIGVATQPLGLSGSAHFLETPMSGPRNKGGTSTSLYVDDVSEDKLVQELVYCFQGVEGQVLKREAGGGFYIEPKSKLRRTHYRLVLRLAELGYLHDKVKQYIDIDSGMAPLGLVGQGFISELRKELTEYYRMVAVLHEQVRNNMDYIDCNRRNDPVTLLKLVCWVRRPMHRLQWLCNIANACEGQKGGQLASTVYGFLWHGDPRVTALAHQLLSAACGPLYTMLTDWLLDGEIKDPSQEFFVEAVPNVSGDRLWHQKYRVRSNMLPDFLSIEQAERVLATGKCINFLREVCQDNLPLAGREALKRVLHNSSVKSLYDNGKDSILHSVMDSAYRDASRRVLDTLMGPHKLVEHLQAFRRYLLLGQGDFIRHLMELLDPELTKPASLLYRHNMCSMLESAIRATNAQFDDGDILNRLDVKLIESSAGDTGWDIFSLQYHVQGPIGTVFESTEDEYLILFNSLWKSKRMEFILSRLWREQMTSTRCLQKMKKLRPIMQQLHILTSEMVHFIHQIQYYILFEVLECSWAILIEQVNKAESLDDVLTAHQDFLRTVQTGAMYSGSGNNLQILYTPIVDLQRLQTDIYAAAFKELQSRKTYFDRIEQSAKEGVYGVDNAQRFTRDEEKRNFEFFIDVQKDKLNRIASIFGSSCKNFLLMLSLSDNVNLQLLSNRLDFNGYYKRSDLRLNAPLTYQYKRMTLLNAIVSNSKISSHRAKAK